VPDDLRAIFDEDAELYDRARPGYPDALFDDLFALGGIGPGSRVLEIGCGTGQATVTLAERGCVVVAVELGANLAPYPNASVVVSAFEDWPLPEAPFDAVVAFTAFHWVDPAVGIEKVADALRPGGTFATITTDHAAGGTEAFFVDVQDCYERWDPDTPPGLRLQAAADIEPTIVEDATGRFGAAELHRYETDIAYSTAQYVDVIRTYSPTRALDDARRNGLLACIGSLIDSRYGGLIVKRYLRQLRVAHRTP
jgi:SAM-dependent methyltransferase